MTPHNNKTNLSPDGMFVSYKAIQPTSAGVKKPTQPPPDGAAAWISHEYHISTKRPHKSQCQWIWARAPRPRITALRDDDDLARGANETNSAPWSVKSRQPAIIFSTQFLQLLVSPWDRDFVHLTRNIPRCKIFGQRNAPAWSRTCDLSITSPAT